MRARPDAGLRAEIRARLRHVGQWVTIETGVVEQGVPDIYLKPRCAAPGVWIECKKTHANAVVFQPGQVGWLHTHWRYGGRALVFVRQMTRRSRKINVDALHVISGQYVRELVLSGVENVPHELDAMDGGPGRWDWEAVAAFLCAGHRLRRVGTS